MLPKSRLLKIRVSILEFPDQAIRPTPGGVQQIVLARGAMMRRSRLEKMAGDIEVVAHLLIEPLLVRRLRIDIPVVLLALQDQRDTPIDGILQLPVAGSCVDIAGTFHPLVEIGVGRQALGGRAQSVRRRQRPIDRGAYHAERGLRSG